METESDSTSYYSEDKDIFLWYKTNIEKNNFNEYSPDEVIGLDESGCLWIVIFIVVLIFIILI